MIGVENKGYEVIVYLLDRERFALMPSSVMARRIEDTIRWAKETKINGRPVIDQPGARSKLAELLAETAE